MEQGATNAIKLVNTEATESTANKSDESEPPQWFQNGMENVIHRLEQLETGRLDAMASRKSRLCNY
jgi:hypothetical protein